MKSTAIKVIALLLTACVFLGVTSCSLFGGAEEETTEATTREERNKVFIYQEDVERFAEGINEVLSYMRERADLTPKYKEE